MKAKKVKEFNVVIERDSEGYYVASVPVLPGCHTQAKSLDKLIERIQEAIDLCLEVDRGMRFGTPPRFDSFPRHESARFGATPAAR